MPSRTGQVVLVQVNNPRRAVLLIRSDACQVGEELPRTNVEYQGMKMELYAGMVENMDMHVGRLVDYLK